MQMTCMGCGAVVVVVDGQARKFECVSCGFMTFKGDAELVIACAFCGTKTEKIPAGDPIEFSHCRKRLGVPQTPHVERKVPRMPPKAAEPSKEPEAPAKKKKPLGKKKETKSQRTR